MIWQWFSLIHDQKATIDGRDFSGVFYVVDFWKRRDGTWQIVARYSSPVGHKVDRGNRPLPHRLPMSTLS
jgi:hypothetical protein